ncbi:P-loop containing nucleoside triphosphate hydrolase protein [Parasitella parasitica]|nr:P-loop containing nucleoside triphosphate hydrolase protein [Parasitella parasitica]
MGCRLSKQPFESEQDATRSKEIDSQIEQAKTALPHEVKLIILGVGEPGKSTVLKQMRFTIHDRGFSKREHNRFKDIIYPNMAQPMRVILEAMETLQPFGIYETTNLQSVYCQNHEYQLYDSAKYFFDSIDRIGSPVYSPTDQDIHCFENVTAIIFLVGLSEFDQNRMKESLVLFDSICNSKWFKSISTILDKKIYTHFTCATDTEQIGFVMSAVNDIIIQRNLRDVGLL